jgi:TPR repeat protein
VKKLAEEKAKEINEVSEVPSDLQKRRLYRIAWTAVCLLWGGWFSLAVSAPNSSLGLVAVSALAFGGFTAAALLWSNAINKVLSNTAMRVTVIACLIVCAIYALDFVGSLAVRSSTSATSLMTSVSGTSAPSVLNRNASDISKGAVTNAFSGATTGCHPPVLSQQQVSALAEQASSGDAAAECMLGDSYDAGQGVPKDPTLAALWWRKAAEQGNADAQHNLGASYYNGQGVPQDCIQTAFWYRKAAEQGDTEAQDGLGYLYDNGKGVPRDYAQAAFWYRKAAEQGDAEAQYDLGTWYEEGLNQGVPQDEVQTAFWRRKIRVWRAYINSVDFKHSEHWRYTQAAFWYRKAAEQGNSDAQYLLGYFYLNGRGVPRDYTQAVLWYRKAAEQGDADAQEALGDLYNNGRGVPRDYAEAYFWYDLAAAGEDASDEGDASDDPDASGSKHVAKDRDAAASHLTPADLFREQGRAGKWFEAHPTKPQ